MQSTRSTRTRKLIVGAGLALGALTMGSGVAGAFPNGPGIIQNDPQPPPPPQPPLDKAPPPQQPQPPQGPQDLANPEPGPAQPIPGPGPQQGGGVGDGGTPAGGGTGAPNAPTADELAAIADAAEAQQTDAFPVDGVVGKESDRPTTSDVDSTELAAGELRTDQSEAGPWALLTALATALLAGLAGLWFAVTRRRTDDEDTAAA